MGGRPNSDRPQLGGSSCNPGFAAPPLQALCTPLRARRRLVPATSRVTAAPRRGDRGLQTSALRPGCIGCRRGARFSRGRRRACATPSPWSGAHLASRRAAPRRLRRATPWEAPLRSRRARRFALFHVGSGALLLIHAHHRRGHRGLARLFCSRPRLDWRALPCSRPLRCAPGACGSRFIKRAIPGRISWHRLSAGGSSRRFLTTEVLARNLSVRARTARNLGETRLGSWSAFGASTCSCGAGAWSFAAAIQARTRCPPASTSWGASTA